MSVSTRPDLAPLQTVHAHRGLFTVLGIVLVVLGACAFLAAFAFTLAAVFALGCILVVAGIVQIVQAFRSHLHGKSSWVALAGALYILAGVLLMYRPMLGALSVTLILAGFLLVSGVVRMAHAFSMKEFKNWGLLAAGGVIDVVLGVLIFAQWPVSAMWVLGLFLGIDMIFQGIAWITLANSPKLIEGQKLPPSTPSTPSAPTATV
jgi:uncharacterized membrane protein HdeD (DUF308 family)